MSFLKGPYLRILKPRTVDGNIPLLINGEQQYKEDHVPMTAKKVMLERNRRLPSHLKMIIEEVGNEPAPARVAPTPSQTIKKTAQAPEETPAINTVKAETEKATNGTEGNKPAAPAKKKGGRPKKVVA